MQRLREQVAARVPGVTLYLQPVQDLTVDSATGPTEFRFDIEGASTALVNEWAQNMAQALQAVPQVRHATTSAGAQGLAAQVLTDRETASRLGVTAASLDNALYNAYGQRIVSTIFTETNHYRVILQADQGDAAASGLQTLRDLPVKTASGTSVPLGSFASVGEAPADLQITRVGQYPAATVGFDTAAGVSLGAAVQAIRQAEIGRAHV